MPRRRTVGLLVPSELDDGGVVEDRQVVSALDQSGRGVVRFGGRGTRRMGVGLGGRGLRKGRPSGGGAVGRRSVRPVMGLGVSMEPS